MLQFAVLRKDFMKAVCQLMIPIDALFSARSFDPNRSEDGRVCSGLGFKVRFFSRKAWLGVAVCRGIDYADAVTQGIAQNADTICVPREQNVCVCVHSMYVYIHACVLASCVHACTYVIM